MQNKENLKFLIDIIKKDINLYEDEDILQDLFKLRLDTINKCLNKNKIYYENLKKIEEKINNKKLFNLIEEWMCLINENNANINEFNYKMGVKDGISITLSALEDIN